ncbi:MAG: hypothetical protein ACR2QG_01455, partial [Gammaproteobacteria bacterium]
MTETLRCLFDEERGAEGGRAEVHLLEDCSGREVIDAAGRALQELPATECVRVFVAGSGNLFTAESFSPTGQRIRFCGHGALAAAQTVFDRDGINAAEFTNKERNWLAQREADDSDLITLTYEKPTLRLCDVPDYAFKILGVSPLQAALAGAESDYLILELAESELVQKLQPDLQALTSAT